MPDTCCKKLFSLDVEEPFVTKDFLENSLPALSGSCIGWGLFLQDPEAEDPKGKREPEGG